MPNGPLRGGHFRRLGPVAIVAWALLAAGCSEQSSAERLAAGEQTTGKRA